MLSKPQEKELTLRAFAAARFHRTEDGLETERALYALVASWLAEARREEREEAARLAIATAEHYEHREATGSATVARCEAHGLVGSSMRGLAAEIRAGGPEAKPSEPRRIDPKFHIAPGGREIVKTSSGETIPDDEPLMLLRARDHLALPLLWHYEELSRLDGCNDYHLSGLAERVREFGQYKSGHPEMMKQPGVTRGAPFAPGSGSK